MKIACRRFFRLASPAMVLTTALLIAGCTTTQPVQQCSPKEKARLSSNVASTKAKLEQSKAQLARTRTELSKQSCFSAGKSTSCTRLKTRADKLQSDVKTLENQLSELNATIAGRSHAGRYVQACSATWAPARKAQKAAPRKTASNKISKNDQTKVAKTVSEPVEDFVVPPYEASESSYAPTSQPKVQPTDYIAPTATTPPAERTYTESSKVRVVGSSFYPDQSKPVGPQAPDHAPAP